MRILHGLARLVATEQGDVKQLSDITPPELRLRIGDYRVRFYDHGETIEILAVKHRREAHRKTPVRLPGETRRPRPAASRIIKSRGAG